MTRALLITVLYFAIGAVFLACSRLALEAPSFAETPLLRWALVVILAHIGFSFWDLARGKR